MRYRSKPSVIEAVQWRGNNIEELKRFAPDKVHQRTDLTDEGDIRILGLMLNAGPDGDQGWVPVPEGSWLVRKPGDVSDIWPVSEDYFRDKYEAAP